MVLKSCRIALEWVVGLVAGLALLAALGLLWLSREPLPVDFVEPYIEAALSRENGVTVEVGATQLVWAGWGSRIEVAAQDWKVHDADSRRLLTVPRGSIELSLSALLRGQIAPTAIALHDLSISLLRRPDGRFAFGRETGPEPIAGIPEEEAAAEQSALRFLFTPLADKPDPRNPFAQLADVTIVKASALLIDQRLGAVWRAPFVDLKIQRDPSGASATGSATIALGEKRSQLDLTMTQVAGAPGLETVIGIGSLEPAALAAVLEEAAPLEALDGAVTGRVGLTIAEDGRPSAAAIELSGEALTLDLPEWLEQPLTFADVVVAAHSEGQDQPLVLDELSGSVAPAGGGAGPAFSVSAIVEDREPAILVKLAADVGRIPARDLRLYWPKGVGGNGRDWVLENITGGAASAASLSTTFSLDRDSLELHSIDTFGGRFRYEDLEVHYLRPLPPLTGAAGSAAYDLAGLDFTVTEARLDEITLGGGDISIFGLEGDDHEISIAFDAAGPLRQALALLDHERLGLLDTLAIEPGAASGRFTSRASFAFPLIDDLEFEQIEIGVEGELAEVALAGSVAGHDLERGRFDLTLDGDGLTARGEAAVAGIPLQATWSESFLAVAMPTRATATVAAVSLADLGRFGLDVGDRAEGTVALELEVAANHRGDARIGLDADLRDLEAALPTVAWRKRRGEPGRLQAAVEVAGGEVTRIGELSAELGDGALQGEIALTGTGGLERAALERLAFGGNRVTDVVVTPYEGDGYAVAVRAGVLDLAPLLAETEGQAAVAPEPEPPDTGEEGEGAPYTPLRLEASALARVHLGEGRALENVGLELERDRRGWQLIRAEAQIPRDLWRHENRPVPEDAALAAKSMSVHYRPEADGSYRFELFADDIGATLRALGWIDSIEGGRGEIVGTLPGPLPEAPLEARVETTGFRIVQAPAMAKLLTVASLTGIGNLLSGEGIQFDRAVGRITLDDDVVTTPLFRAYGSSLGITARGEIDLEGAATDVSGTLVPAYSVNRILGEIPILGRILTGGEGEGILGVTYRVTGDVADPEVSVNPLSILAPGFLRGLFGVPKDDGDEPEELTDVFPSGDVGR